MRAVGQAKALAAAAVAAARAAESKADIVKHRPIMAAMAVTAADGRLAFCANSLDLQITADVTAEIADPGMIAVPAVQLAKLFGSLPGGTMVMLASEANGLAVKTSSGRWRLLALPAEDFPAPMAPDGGEAITLDAAVVKQLFASVAFASETEHTRFYLCGVYLYADPHGQLSAVASDGHQLAMASTKVQAANMFPADTAGIIVPTITVNEIARLKYGLTMRSDGRLIEIKADNIVIVSRLIDGTYPNFQAVLPKPSTNTAVVERLALLAGLRRIAAVAGDHSSLIAWNGDGDVRLSVAHAAELADDQIAADTAGALQVIVPHGQFINLLENLHAGAVQLDAANGTNPLRITIAGRGDFLAIQMPSSR